MASRVPSNQKDGAAPAPSPRSAPGAGPAKEPHKPSTRSTTKSDAQHDAATGNQSGQQTKQQSNQQSKHQSGQQTKQQSGQQHKHQSGQQTTPQSGQQTKQQSGQQTTAQSGQQNKQQSGPQTNDPFMHQNGGEPDHNSGNQPGDQSDRNIDQHSGQQTEHRSHQQIDRQSVPQHYQQPADQFYQQPLGQFGAGFGDVQNHLLGALPPQDRDAYFAWIAQQTGFLNGPRFNADPLPMNPGPMAPPAPAVGQFVDQYAPVPFSSSAPVPDPIPVPKPRRDDDEDEDDTIPKEEDGLDTIPDDVVTELLDIPGDIDYSGPLLIRTPHSTRVGYEWLELTPHGQYRLSTWAKSNSIRQLFNMPSDRFLVKKGAVQDEQVRSRLGVEPGHIPGPFANSFREQFGRYNCAIAIMVASRGEKIKEAFCSRNSRKIFVQTIVAKGIGNGACAGCRWSEAAKDCDFSDGKTEDKSEAKSKDKSEAKSKARCKGKSASGTASGTAAGSSRVHTPIPRRSKPVPISSSSFASATKPQSGHGMKRYRSEVESSSESSEDSGEESDDSVQILSTTRAGDRTRSGAATSKRSRVTRNGSISGSAMARPASGDGDTPELMVHNGFVYQKIGQSRSHQ